MSAFFVGKETIDATVALIALRTGGMPHHAATNLGKSLWRNNALALGDCYGDDADEFSEIIAGYRYTAPPLSGGLLPNIVTVFKAAQCYQYQCSEGSVYENSLYKFVDWALQRYVHLKKAPNYDDAPWGLCE
jgi:hypothetical protein